MAGISQADTDITNKYGTSGVFSALGHEMRQAKGLEKIAVFGIGVIAAMSAICTAALANPHRALDSFETVVSWRYGDSVQKAKQIASPFFGGKAKPKYEVVKSDEAPESDNVGERSNFIPTEVDPNNKNFKKVQFFGGKVEVIGNKNGADKEARPDILKSDAEVVVSPGNTHLRTSGNKGLHGLFIQLGGDVFKQALTNLKNQLNGNFQSGDAALLPAGQISEKNESIKQIIVVAPPNMRGRSDSTPTDADKKQLFACYYNALALANSRGMKKIAFGSLGTGINNFDPQIGAKIALETMEQFYKDNENCEMEIEIYALNENEFNGYRYPNGKILPFKPAASERKNRESIIRSAPPMAAEALRTLVAEVPVDLVAVNKLEEYKEKAENKQHLTGDVFSKKHNTVFKLMNNSQLGHDDIGQFAAALRAKYPHRPFNYHPMFGYDPHVIEDALPDWVDETSEKLMPEQGADAVGIQQGDKPLPLSIFPIGVDGRFRNHWLLAVVDPNTGMIWVYDSKGLTIEDRSSTRLHAYPKYTLKSLVNKIALHYTSKYPEKNWKVKENVERDQVDAHNCGVFIAHAMEELIAGKSKISRLTSDEASTEKRGSMCTDILNTCQVHYDELDKLDDPLALAEHTNELARREADKENVNESNKDDVDLRSWDAI